MIKGKKERKKERKKGRKIQVVSCKKGKIN